MSTATRLTEGQQAPDFTLTDSTGATHRLADLAGRRVVVYFYPKASTPGCTTEACDFRDQLDSLKAHGYTVLGISPDSEEALRRFVEREQLTFPLLSDPDHAVAEVYGAWGEKTNYGKTSVGLIRSTIVLDEQHRVLLALYNVRAKGHVARLRRELGIDG